ncbi:MAG: hypothetical protein H6733_01370 [Alphaproteobacteria bacterium]|nr:hypothetical protein [Alphaproteobacteria bacterium]
MRLDPSQRQGLRDVLVTLHLRDEARGLLPAVDRGPPKGLMDATVRGVTRGTALPWLGQLPPNVDYAAQACQRLAAHPLTAALLDAWIARNLDAALHEPDPHTEAALPLAGCRTHEDVRNRLLVDLDELSAADLDRLSTVLRRRRRVPARRRLAWTAG